MTDAELSLSNLREANYRYVRAMECELECLQNIIVDDHVTGNTHSYLLGRQYAIKRQIELYYSVVIKREEKNTEGID